MRGTCNALFDRDGEGKDEVVVICANCNTEQVVAEKVGKIYIEENYMSEKFHICLDKH